MYQNLATLVAMKGSTTGHVWAASDLARFRTDVLAQAEARGTFVRATSGALLVFAKADRLEAFDGRHRLTLLLGAAIKSLMSDDVSPGDLGEIAFIADWSVDRRRRFVADLREVAFHALSTNDFDEITAFLDASRPRVATGVLDPARIAAALDSGAARL